MPELPEVETTRLGLIDHLQYQTISDVIIRQAKLRWLIPKKLPKLLKQQTILELKRRGKYLLLTTEKGTVIIHLGMSGHLKIVSRNEPAKKHDHVDIVLKNNHCLRFTDPRRFGCILWTNHNPLEHKLLIKLGVEPLTPLFNGKFLYQQSRKHKITVKSFIMNHRIVVGVGNIYANEALFAARINPRKKVHKITLEQYVLLANCIKKILKQAIHKGGTTLKDFLKVDGKPGYFSNQLKTYDRAKEPCLNCHTPIRSIRQQQRSTYYCPTCQT